MLPDHCICSCFTLPWVVSVQESKVGLRWRTEQEVVVGKGQFACGAKSCDERRALASYEVPSWLAIHQSCLGRFALSCVHSSELVTFVYFRAASCLFVCLFDSLLSLGPTNSQQTNFCLCKFVQSCTSAQHIPCFRCLCMYAYVSVCAAHTS